MSKLDELKNLVNQYGAAMAVTSNARDRYRKASWDHVAQYEKSLLDAIAELVKDSERYDKVIRANRPYVIKIQGDQIHCGGHARYNREKMALAIDEAVDTAMKGTVND